MIKRVPMTTNGEIILQKELLELKTIKRPKVILDISEARAHGDLKENAEYHAAKEKQSFIEGRINNIESKLSNAQVIDIKSITNKGIVIFGSTVKLHNQTNNEKVGYKIVGEDEADVSSQKISFTSPLARSLIGRGVDDTVQVGSAHNATIYDIISVSHL